MAESKWVYSFVLWPSETWGFKPELFQVFGILSSRVEMELTVPEFESLRSRLNHDGFTLREISRHPWSAEETIL